ncbi:hypothetical protein CHCC15543_1205 [Bacillus licheniformis]|nr:hypothetical protein CHCC15543_1205 [Bacillus licheniformis]
MGIMTNKYPMDYSPGPLGGYSCLFVWSEGFSAICSLFF